MTAPMVGGRHARGPLAAPTMPAGVRPTVLFARARNVPVFVAGIVVLALLAWWASEWLTSRPMSQGPIDRKPVAALAPLALAIVVSTTLFAADEELERTGAWRWRWVRLAQLVVLAVAGVAALMATALEDPRLFGAAELARNSMACIGMVALAAPVVGGRLAWAPVFGYVITVSSVASRVDTVATGWWTWPVQPWESEPAWWVAATWFVAGVGAYAWWGSRTRRHQDP